MSIQAAHKLRMKLDALAYAARVFEALDSPISLSCALLIKHKEYRQLAEKRIDPRDYLDPFTFFLDYQSVKLLSKYPFMDTGINTEEVARKKFYETEESCRRTNHRWRLRSDGHHFSAQLERVISRAQSKIASILGDVPSFEQLDFAFGPGAAYGVRKETSVFNKVSAALECTYVFADYLPEFLGEFPGWISSDSAEVRLIPGSQLAFVPKDARTDRPICIEPLLNGLYQKGIGSYIGDRLRKFGIDLGNQGVNQKLASVAGCSGLSTIDFTSASDTISYSTVMNLLPWDWFCLLEAGRCPRFEDSGTWKSFQKFSSMGNAYTFELETLIFYALACASAEELGVPFKTGQTLSVYGDDVIIPEAVYDLFSEVTVACGFAINHEKSFRKGVFFESCGHDYFLGTFVRPFLLKQRINTLLPAFYGSNILRRICDRLPSGKASRKYPWSSDQEDSRQAVARRLDGVRSWVIGHIPAPYRCMGPEGYGDGHIIAPLDEAMTSRPSRVSRHSSWDGWHFQSYSEVASLVSLDSYPSAYALYFTMRRNSNSLFGAPITLRNGDGYTVRGRSKLRRLRLFCHSEWMTSERRQL